MAEATQTQPQVGTFCWNEVVTRGGDEACSFYKNLFGWTTEEMDMGGTKYTMFKKGETYAAGCMQMEGPQFDGVPPHWLAYVAVDDVNATVEKVTSLGGNVVVPPTELPMGTFAIISDPSEAVVGIWKGGTGCE